MNLNSIIKAASAAAPVLANNKQLPELAAWKARSFWLTAITGAVAVANSQGIDLLGHLGEIGLGRSPDAVVDNAVRGVSAVQTLLPFATGTWAWIGARPTSAWSSGSGPAPMDERDFDRAEMIAAAVWGG